MILAKLITRYQAAPFFVSRKIASRIHEISDPKKALVLSLRAEYTRSRVQKKDTEHEDLATVYVVLPSLRAEEFKEKYPKKRTNEACVLVRCISWLDCGVSSDERANIIVCTSLLSDIKYDSS